MSWPRGPTAVSSLDELGREALAYVPGESGRHGPYDDGTLAETARTIRRFHDAVVGFVPPAGSICHHDLSPPNPRGGSFRCTWTTTARASGFLDLLRVYLREQDVPFARHTLAKLDDWRLTGYLT